MIKLVKKLKVPIILKREESGSHPFPFIENFWHNKNKNHFISSSAKTPLSKKCERILKSPNGTLSTTPVFIYEPDWLASNFYNEKIIHGKPTYWHAKIRVCKCMGKKFRYSFGLVPKYNNFRLSVCKV